MRETDAGRRDAGTAPSGGELDAFAARVPKAELHLHLDGSLRPATALELARDRGLADRRTTVESMRRRLTAPTRGTDQAALLRAFELPILLLQDADSLTRVARELVEDVAADGTRYVEIRWAPALHVARGLSLADGLAAVVAGTAEGAARTGVTARLIAVAMRSHDPRQNVAVAEAAARFRGQGLVGFDLAGPEAAFPDPSRQRRAFAAARRAGLRITLHAGEWGGAAQVRAALALDPERIAHGAPAIDDPSLVAELIARRVTLDLCPTSNVQAGIARSVATHPLPRLVRAGVRVTLSTDDRTVSALTLTEEYRRVLRRARLTPRQLWAIDRHALEAAFADEATLTPLRADFDDWAAGEPLLAGSG